MTFADTQRRVEVAAAALARAAAGARGWADGQRRAFDRDRMEPLADAAVRLSTALGKADEARDKADRLLADLSTTTAHLVTCAAAPVPPHARPPAPAGPPA